MMPKTTIIQYCVLAVAMLPGVAAASSLSSASTGNAIPTGMVAAFDGSCPSGWSEYSAANGRAIIGDGYFSQSFRGQSYSANYSLGQTGGIRAYRLAGSEIPSNRSGTDATKFESCWDCPGSPTPTSQRSHSGYGGSFDNMGPYLVLNYCRKN